MSQLTKYPHTNQLRHVVESVRSVATYHEFTELPTLKFKGTVKLHGTNSSVVKDLKTHEIWPQSREQLLSLTQDNAGFVRWSFDNLPAIETLLQLYQEVADEELEISTDDGRLAIYGEWCGKGIMKGVAINQLEKMFVVFGVKYTPTVEKLNWRNVELSTPRVGQSIIGRNDKFETWEEVWDDSEPLGLLTHWLPANGLDGTWINSNLDEAIEKFGGNKEVFESSRIFNINSFPTFEIEIDFNNPEGSIEKLTALTSQVENLCPVGNAFGVTGTGEGIVWKSVINWCNTGELRFKTKGDKHKESAGDKIAVDPVKVASINAFVDGVATEHRFEKMMEKLIIAGVAIKVENTPQFLKLVGEDVLREEADVLEASGLDRKAVMGTVNKVARTWWLSQANSQPM